MRYTRYLRYEKNIAASDTSGIRQRWEFGRALLVDDTTTTPAGNLRNGVIDGLVAEAKRAGLKLSEREIQHRLQAGRAYPTEGQITYICASYETWGALRAAGFPVVLADVDEEPYDPRQAAERARDAARSLARHGQGGTGQLALFEYFPDDRFDETSTLAELAKYAAEMSALTERFAARDAERGAYLAKLITAVNGDMSATWEQAESALGKAA